VTNRVLIGDLDPLVARGLMQTLIEEHYDVLDATMTNHLDDLADAVVRLHPDAVIVRMTPEPEATVRALRARQPQLQVVECDDDRPRLRVHPIGGTAYTLEPVTASTLREALSVSSSVVDGRAADVR
jgi:AmiR/NasT family two-component response regulator